MGALSAKHTIEKGVDFFIIASCKKIQREAEENEHIKCYWIVLYLHSMRGQTRSEHI